MNVHSGHDMKCGHSEPSSDKTSHMAQSVYPFSSEFKLSLDDKDNAQILINQSQYV